ncbi:MAG: hypothetical protein R3Y50_05955 [Rikenellaceae bacterium]
MAEAYATGRDSNGKTTYYQRKSDYQAGRATKSKSAAQRTRRVYAKLS